jgi:hypothetical protein
MAMGTPASAISSKNQPGSSASGRRAWVEQSVNPAASMSAFSERASARRAARVSSVRPRRKGSTEVTPRLAILASVAGRSSRTFINV